MSIHSILRKEGITQITALNGVQTNLIANNVAEKICLAFPEHDINKHDLFIMFSKINMYTAKMPESLADAKYFYKENSIYFNDVVDINILDKLAMHECIHVMQQVLDNSGNLTRLGLCHLPLSKQTGKALNEASVQFMASIANQAKLDTVKYYDICLNTITPSYYALECTIVEQLSYFTGTYPLFHSTLNSNDVFKNTIVAKAGLDTYNTIESKLDDLLELEEELSYIMTELQHCNGNIRKIKRLNNEIACGKELISSRFFELQDYIMDVFFTSDFNNIKNLKDVTTFKERLYNYKNFIGYHNDYTFYNNFYCDMMSSLEKKVDYIKQYGSIDLIGSLNPGLALIPAAKASLSFFKRLLLRLGILVQKRG